MSKTEIRLAATARQRGEKKTEVRNPNANGCRDLLHMAKSQASAADSSLSSIPDGGEGRGEAARDLWETPLPARVSRGESDLVTSAFGFRISFGLRPSDFGFYYAMSRAQLPAA
jgi:hypothetical protein